MRGRFLFFSGTGRCQPELADGGVLCRNGVRLHTEGPGRVHALLVMVTQLALHIFANGAEMTATRRAGEDQETLAADGAANVAADIGGMAFDRHGDTALRKP
jgi:hypothetical protein